MLVWVVTLVALAPLFARRVPTTGAVTPPVVSRPLAISARRVVMRAGLGGPSADGIHPSRTRIGRQARDLHDRPDVDGAQACPWNPCGSADRLVKILGVDQELAAEQFARLRERPVGDEQFAVAHPDAGRGRRRV